MKSNLPYINICLPIILILQMLHNDTKKKKDKTRRNSFFDCAQLFAQLSITVAIAVYAVVQSDRDQQIAQDNRLQDILLANETRNKDLTIAENNRFNDILIADDQQKENILIEYQNFMSELLLKYGIILNDTAVRFVARFETLAALEQLNPARRSFLIRSLTEAQLVTYNDHLESASLHPIIQLSMANLTEINLGLMDETTFLPDSHRCLAFDSTTLNRASLHKLNLYGSTFINARLNYADFSFISTSGSYSCYRRDRIPRVSTTFTDAYMYYVNFYQATFDDADFAFARMIGANMSKTYFLGDTNFAHASLEESNFYMAEFSKGLHIFGSANMTNMNGTHGRFNRCTFYETALVNCCLNDATINGSRFSLANMTNCQLKDAQLTNVYFLDTIMINVDMINMTCLANCTFYRCNLTGAILHNAAIMSTSLLNAAFTDEQLAQTRSLAGSTLPNGTKIPL